MIVYVVIELETVAAVNFSPSLALYCIFFNIIVLQFLVWTSTYVYLMPI